jgi:hypothetical protein
MNINITISPLGAILIAALAILWIVAGIHPSHAVVRLVSDATPFLLLAATWLVLLAMLRRPLR